MPTAATDRVMLDADGGQMAFRAAQLFEELLLERAVQHARREGKSVVTSEIISSCLRHPLLDVLDEEFRKRLNGEAGPDGSQAA